MKPDFYQFIQTNRASNEGSKSKLIEMLNTDSEFSDYYMILSEIGSAFLTLAIFEESAASNIIISKTKLSQKLSGDAIEEAGLFSERVENVSNSTLGRLVSALENSGLKGRDISYLRAIVGLRNEFVHRFTQQGPLPDQWYRFGYGPSDLSVYLQYFERHIQTARRQLPRIMLHRGLLAGEKTKLGIFVYHPDGPIATTRPPLSEGEI